MKSIVLKECEEYLYSCALNLQENEYCDVLANQTFVEKKWLGGSFKLDYELYLSIDSNEKIIYVLEKTLQKSSGFSFGTSSSSLFQQGTKVYRKVKANHKGLNGKAYDFDLDLGEILKNIENISIKHDYKFKEVIYLNVLKEAKLTQ